MSRSESESANVLSESLDERSERELTVSLRVWMWDLRERWREGVSCGGLPLPGFSSYYAITQPTRLVTTTIPEHSSYHFWNDDLTPKSRSKYATHSFSRIMYQIILELPYHENTTWISKLSYVRLPLHCRIPVPANETTNVLVRPFLLVYYSTMNTLPNVPHMLPSVTYVCMLIPVIPHVMQEYVMILKMDSRSHYTYANTITRHERQSMYPCNIPK